MSLVTAKALISKTVISLVRRQEPGVKESAQNEFFENIGRERKATGETM